MKYLAGFMLIMLLVLAPSCKWLRERGIFGKKADTLTVWLARQDSIRVLDSIRKEQERLLAIENARMDSMKRVEEWNQSNRFNIIIGSFITPEYARKYSENFASQGYQTRILPLEGTKFEMVSAEAHNNLRQAISRLRNYQDTVIIDAWIYTVPVGK